MKEFTIRTAKLEDREKIHAAHMRSIREICIQEHGAEEVQHWGNRPLGNRWIDSIKNDFVWVIERNQKIYGHAYIRIFKDGESMKAHIHGLYVTPEILNKGFGFKLATKMIDQAKALNVKEISLESTLTAHKFYQRLGFQDTGPLNTMKVGKQSIRYIPMKMTFD